MPKDNLFAHGQDDGAPFEFNEAVADVFPDMLKRSIPGYRASIQAIGTLASKYVQANSRCYDLGASLGAAALAMRDAVRVEGCRIVAVDNSSAMVERCRDLLSTRARPKGAGAEVSVLEADISDVEIRNASMIVMNYTLQFLPLEARDATISRIAEGMNPGGLFILSEKVVDEDESVEEVLVNLHHDFKRRNLYSELEIARKRSALENVLVPESTTTHRDRLRRAGFAHVGIWLRYFNFVSIVAIR